MAESLVKPRNTKNVHAIIGVAIMILFRFLPISLPEITDIGMVIIGIFIGTLYLWITTDVFYSSLISFAMICFSGYAPLNELLTSFLGNANIQLTIFMLITAAMLSENKITTYLARFFLTLKIAKGRPWVLTFTITIGCFLMSAFCDFFAPIFLFWPIVYDICKEVGYKKFDKYPTIMIILVMVGSILGFPVPPYYRNGLALISSFKALTSELPGGPVVVSDGAYFATCLILGIIITTLVVLFCKYVLRPDVSKLKNYDNEALKANPLPPMTIKQKSISVGYIVLIAALLFPSLLPKTIPGFAFLSEHSQLLPLVVVGILGAIHLKGESLLDIGQTIKNISWPMIFMIANAFVLGAALTSEATGVTGFLNYMLTPIFSGMSVIVFTVVLLIIGCILTNFCNSFVICLLLQPFIMTYCAATGANPIPIVILLIFVTMTTALCTPAASPFAAILHGNKEWLLSKDIYKYVISIVGFMLVVEIALGIPLANFFSNLLV